MLVFAAGWSRWFFFPEEMSFFFFFPLKCVGYQTEELYIFLFLWSDKEKKKNPEHLILK